MFRIGYNYELLLMLPCQAQPSYFVEFLRSFLYKLEEKFPFIVDSEVVKLFNVALASFFPLKRNEGMFR